MIEQLRAATATGKVYVAVSDAIGDLLVEVERSLEKLHLDDVTVLTFPESKLKNTFAKLRAGLALAGGVAFVTADQIAEVYDE